MNAETSTLGFTTARITRAVTLGTRGAELFEGEAIGLLGAERPAHARH